MSEPDLKLGLIGDNITKSKAPTLHRLAGNQHNINVQYDRLVPPALSSSFDAVFKECGQRAYRGVNVTYPYKETAAKVVEIQDPLVASIGAVNTVIFEANGPQGYNTDYSGFVSAYKNVRADNLPGVSCLVGTGGVGRALAFGLIALGASEIRLFDRDKSKAEALAHDLRKATRDTTIKVFDALNLAMDAVDGVLNGTPIGMVGYGGTPVQAELLSDVKWVFDAVYTPIMTPFLVDSKERDIQIISGYELFFYQGVHAWRLFSGLGLDETRLRKDLSESQDK